MRYLVLFAVLAALAGCDPMVNIQGSFWPAWIICIFAGLAACVAESWLLAAARLAPHLGPPPLIYPSLWALNTFLLWLLLYAD